jgi:hypothetical protein
MTPLLDDAEVPALTRDGFRTWLQTLSPRAHVGRPGSECACPLARYLKARCPDARYVSITPYAYRVGRADEYTKAETPTWARRFMRAVDCSPLRVRIITAVRALRLLQEIPE